MFKCSEEDPFYCHLIEEWTGKTRTFIFKRANVEFTSMKDEEVTLIMYPYPTEIVKWGVTCEFLSIKQARKFYRYITHDRQSELVNAYGPTRNRIIFSIKLSNCDKLQTILSP